MVHLVQCISCKPVITTVVVRYQRLNAAITNVLELFVVRTIHISFKCACSISAPSNIQYLLHLGVCYLQLSIEFERIACKCSVKIFNNQWLIFGSNIQKNISECAETKCSEILIVSIIRNNTVLSSNEFV